MVPSGPRVSLLVPVVSPGPLARALCVTRGRPLSGPCLTPATGLCTELLGAAATGCKQKGRPVLCGLWPGLAGSLSPQGSALDDSPWGLGFPPRGLQSISWPQGTAPLALGHRLSSLLPLAGVSAASGARLPWRSVWVGIPVLGVGGGRPNSPPAGGERTHSRGGRPLGPGSDPAGRSSGAPGAAGGRPECRVDDSHGTSPRTRKPRQVLAAE